MKSKFLVALFAALCICLPGCRTSTPNAPNTPNTSGNFVRQVINDLPEPTFQTVLVYVHDYSALGAKKLVERNASTKVPLRVLSDSALSVLEKEVVMIVDVIELSTSLDEIKEGNVKQYLNMAWMIIELNGLTDRTQLTKTLTTREQQLLIALFKGIRLGTGDVVNAEKVLNSVGPRW